jgi:hypothetical protein
LSSGNGGHSFVLEGRKSGKKEGKDVGRNVYRNRAKKEVNRSKKVTWRDNIEIILKERSCDVVDWSYLAQWRAVVNMVMNIRVP